MTFQLSTLMLMGAVALGRAVKGESTSEPLVDFGELQQRLRDDPQVKKADRAVAAALAEVRAYNEKVSQVLSTRSPVTLKPGASISTRMPGRLDNAYRAAMSQQQKAKAVAFRRLQHEVLDRLLERDRGDVAQV